MCGFYNARVDALHSMSIILGTDSAAYVHLRESIQSDQAIAKKTILEVQRYLPEIAANIATLRASRSMLNAQRAATMELYEGGFLDKLEQSKVVHGIEHKMHELLIHPPPIEMPSKRDLIKEISWLHDASGEVIEELTNGAVETFVEAGDVIIRQGEVGNNLFLIARGTCKIEINNDKGEAELVGEIGVGQVVGELAWLTNKPRQANVLAASRGIVYSISGNTLSELMDREKGNNMLEKLTAEAEKGETPIDRQTTAAGNREESIRIKKNLGAIRKRLWESAGWRLGENLLRYQEPYTTWDRAELRRWLVQWRLFHPQKHMGVEVVRPCILLDGSCAEPWQETTGEATEAPFYLRPKAGAPMKLTFSPNAKIFCPPGALKMNKSAKSSAGVSTANKSLFQAQGWNLIKNKMVDDKKQGWGKLAVNLHKEVERMHGDGSAGIATGIATLGSATEIGADDGKYKERRNSQSMLAENLHLKLIDGDGAEGEGRTDSDVIDPNNSTLRRKNKNKITVVPEDRSVKLSDTKGSGIGLTKHNELEDITGRGRQQKILKEISFRHAEDMLGGPMGSGGLSLDAQLKLTSPTQDKQGLVAKLNQSVRGAAKHPRFKNMGKSAKKDAEGGPVASSKHPDLNMR